MADLPASKARRPFFAKATGRAFASRVVDGRTVIDIMDEIGEAGVDTADIAQQLVGAGAVTLRLTSPGGDAFGGLAIHSLLSSHAGHVRVEIIGVAASAASLIAMAGDEIAIGENAHLLVHRAWGLTIGNEADHDEAAALLRRVDGSMADIYAKRTGQPLATITRMLEAETWFTADEAIAAGFADEKIEAPSRPKARFDLSVFANVPAELAGDIERDDPSIRDIEAALIDSGFSRSQARAIASRGHHGDEQREAAQIAELAAHIEQAFPTI